MKKIEYEIRFANINKDKIRERLKRLNFQLILPETLTKRVVFRTKKYGKNNICRWIRVRSIGEKTTLTAKELIGDQKFPKEVEVEVGSFDNVVEILELAGLSRISYQETLRESWKKDGVEIEIDTWPGINPSLEIETEKEKDLKKISKELGFEMKNGFIEDMDKFYKRLTGKFLSEFEFVSFEKMFLRK